MKKNKLYLVLYFTLLLCLLFKNALWVLIFLILHESSHCLAAKLLGYKINGVKLLLFGLNANIENEFIKPLDNIIISIVGPLFNLIMALLFFSVKSTEFDFEFFVNINYSLFIFNLIPAGFLDGGRILKTILEQFMGFYIGEFIINLNGIIFGCIILVVVICNRLSFNSIAIISMGLFFIINSINELRYIKSNIIKLMILKTTYVNNKGKMVVRSYIINKNYKLLDLLKNLCLNYYYKFYIFYGKTNVIELFEDEIFNYYLKYGNIYLNELLSLKEINKLVIQEETNENYR